MINLLYLITSLGPGGAERTVADLSNCLDKNKFKVFVIGMNNEDGMHSEFRNNMICVRSLNMRKNIIDFIKVIVEIFSFCRENKIDIIHAHLPHALLPTILTKLIDGGIKIVFTPHNTNFESFILKIFVFATKRFRDRDVLFSRHMDSFIYSFKKTAYISNGIEIKTLNTEYKKNHVFTFVNIGRLEKQKNQEVLIRSMRYLMDRNINAILIIIGEGENRSYLTDLITELKLLNVVEILGNKKNVYEYLSTSHAFVLSSLWEGLPLSILEAASIKLPIISTPVGSIPSLINKSNGYLSDISDFANTMLHVYDNYNDALLKAELLKKTINEKHNIQYIMQQHEKMYVNLIK